MHARQSVTSLRETEPAGNSEKSKTSRACFAFEAFDAPAFVTDFDAPADFVTPGAFAFVAFVAFVAFEATGLLPAAVFFGADFFEAFGASAFLPAAFFTFD